MPAQAVSPIVPHIVEVLAPPASPAMDSAPANHACLAQQLTAIPVHSMLPTSRPAQPARTPPTLFRMANVLFALQSAPTTAPAPWLQRQSPLYLAQPDST